MRYPILTDVLRTQELVLPGEPRDYIVQQHGGWWMVTRQADLQTVYVGPGPVEVLLSRAPF
jgi:hypothetical protein